MDTFRSELIRVRIVTSVMCRVMVRLRKLYLIDQDEAAIYSGKGEGCNYKDFKGDKEVSGHPRTVTGVIEVSGHPRTVMTRG